MESGQRCLTITKWDYSFLGEHIYIEPTNFWGYPMGISWEISPTVYFWICLKIGDTPMHGHFHVRKTLEPKHPSRFSQWLLGSMGFGSGSFVGNWRAGTLETHNLWFFGVKIAMFLGHLRTGVIWASKMGFHGIWADVGGGRSSQTMYA